MAIGVFELVLGIVLIGSISGIATQGIKLEREKVRARERGSDGEAAAMNAVVGDLHQEVARLKDRVKVLEKLVTDDDRRLADEIERLRRDPGRPNV
ncbi:MAG: hypothetical protein R3C46_02190 [Hyphomonadaceae bacterium]